jgi:sugar lactone lactonase YvrE
VTLCEDAWGKGVAVQEFLAKPCTTDQYYLGECCRWDDVRGELYWIDILTGRFFRAHADGPNIDVVRSYKLEGSLTALAPSAQRSDGWIVALDQSILLLAESGETREVARPEGHRAPGVRLNDGAADPWGRFWIGSMALDESVGAGSLYRFQESTGAELMRAHVSVSNGLGWSPDRRTMYYVDSGPGTIHAFDVDESGEISHQRPFAQFDTNEEGAPDGLCVDRHGNVWVAVWGGYEVRQYSPGGEHLSRVRIATAQPSCCALGGANGTTLYVTTAQENMSAASLASQPDAGRLFCVDVQVEGQSIDAYCPAPRAVNEHVDPRRVDQ